MSVVTVPPDNSFSPPLSRWRLGPARLLASFLVAMLMAGLSVVGVQMQAQAASNDPPIYGHGANRFFAYLQPGEFLVADGNISAVTAPDGTLVGNGGGTYGPAESAGVWTVDSPALGINELYDWRVDAQAPDGTNIPGRVWTNSYGMGQTSAGTSDARFWIVNNTGYLYEVFLDDYNGINSYIGANSIGYADENCAPTYNSREGYGADVCGDPFRVFFEEPAGDLPESAPSSGGQIYVMPELLSEDDLTVEGLTFTPAGSGSAEGAFTWSMTERYNGSYWLEIDVDGDGNYDGDRDRRILMGADGSGTYAQPFDGLDGQGAAASICTEMNARISFDKLGEVHILQGDVEGRGGIEVRRLSGAGAPDPTIYWDDTNLADNRANTTPVLDGSAGVDSTGGVHGWEYDVNSWGNDRGIDDWAYLPIDHAAQEITFGGTCLEIAKTSTAGAETRPGDVVSYEIVATNTGTADYTDASPAVVLDDLSNVTDDAEIDLGSVAADRDGDLDATDSLISWSGPLAAGEFVTITYDVTLAAGGDGVVRNVAWEPFDPTDATPPACDPPTGEGRDPVTGEPCVFTQQDFPRLSIAKVADQSELPVLGEQVNYTITVTSEGPGDFSAESPATFVDDLSEVLDDADLVEGSLTASVGEATLTGEELAWAGVLAAGEQATVSYTVTYTGEGDHQLDNQVCVPITDALDPVAACATVEIPGAGLQWSKTVNPESATPVEAGEELTYTLTFTNEGNAPASVDTTDDLAGVLDDGVLVAGPNAEEGLTAELTGDVLSISGAVPAGESRTVTYTVQVQDLAATDGDGVLMNELACPLGAPEDCEPQTTTNPVRALAVDKQADPAEGVNTGDVVNYTIAVTNVGEGDYTADSPAVVRDDMSGVLDDALYLGDASVAPNGGTLDWNEPVLTWTGPLAAGETAVITYSVQITNLGDHELQNSAAVECATDACPPPAEVTIPLPHITPDKVSDPQSGASVEAGSEVRYTLTWTNSGQAAGPVDSTDDLAGILDDATITGAPTVEAGDLDVDLSGGVLRIQGQLPPGETAVVTYTATVLPDGERGDNILDNALIPDVPQVEGCEDGECRDVPPPTTRLPIRELLTAKSVDPASGTTVRPDAEVTYTLTFASVGQAPVEVDHEDILTAVLDDAVLIDGPTASRPVLNVTDPNEEDRISISGTLEPGQVETVTYTVRVLPDGQRGDDRLGNFLVHAGEDQPEECLPADPNCTINHVSELDVLKESDPESGSTVTPGQEVTYYVTFTNTSTNAEAAAVPVDHTDHMSDVLDDATLTSGPSVDGAGVQAEVSGESIVITGAVAPGESVVVSYTVTVDEESQGNESLGNVVAPTGEEPICAEGSPLCTNHDVDAAAGPDLPGTGTNVTAAVVAAVALIALGGLALAGQRRKSADRPA